MDIYALLRNIYKYSIDINNIKVIINIPKINEDGITFGESFFNDCNRNCLEYRLRFCIGDEYLEESSYVQSNDLFNTLYEKEKIFFKGIKLENNKCSSVSKAYWIVFKNGVKNMNYKLLNKIPTIII